MLSRKNTQTIRTDRVGKEYIEFVNNREIFEQIRKVSSESILHPEYCVQKKWTLYCRNIIGMYERIIHVHVDLHVLINQSVRKSTAVVSYLPGTIVTSSLNPRISVSRMNLIAFRYIFSIRGELLSARVCLTDEIKGSSIA